MSPTSHDTPLAPNHHAHHPGFSGLSGAFAAVLFSFGRTAAADLAIRLTGTGPGDEVVDIGCGPGVAVRRAAARGASPVLGVDPAPVMLRVARTWARMPGRRGPAGAVRYREGTAESLPADDDSATVVWSLATVHHWHDLDAGLAEVRRVLRPGGRFLVIERQTEPGATGVASHGWTGGQVDLFAERCRAAGFTDVAVDRHEVGRRTVFSALAHAPAR